jgi:hypothetical protein
MVAGGFVVAVQPARVGAAGAGQCAQYSSTGFCVDWGTSSPGGGDGGQPPASGGDPMVVSCSWQDISGFDTSPDSLANFGLAPPPAGVSPVWQTKVCSDGSSQYEFRWIVPVTPANLAATAFGRLEGELPAPSVVSDPPEGTPSIVGVPVFVAVTNWTGVVSDRECAAGLCVTVTATPALVFAPGEPDGPFVACAGSGSRYVTGAGDPAVQAAMPGACAYAYRQRTGVAGRPAAWPGLVAVTWTIDWVASSGETGSLPSVTRSTGVARAVREVQSVVVGGGR